MDTLIAWIMRAIPFGTIIMYGAMGEIVEKMRQPEPRRAGHHVSGRIRRFRKRLSV